MLHWIRGLIKKDRPKYVRGRTTVTFSEEGSIIHFIPSIIDGEHTLVGYAYDDWAKCELDIHSDAILDILKAKARELKMPLMYYYREGKGTSAKKFTKKDIKK